MNETPLVELMAKARESLDAAQVLIDSGHPDFAVSRAVRRTQYLIRESLNPFEHILKDAAQGMVRF